jgi:hypothetical protein
MQLIDKKLLRETNKLRYKGCNFLVSRNVNVMHHSTAHQGFLEEGKNGLLKHEKVNGLKIQPQYVTDINVERYICETTVITGSFQMNQTCGRGIKPPAAANIP